MKTIVIPTVLLGIVCATLIVFGSLCHYAYHAAIIHYYEHPMRDHNTICREYLAAHPDAN